MRRVERIADTLTIFRISVGVPFNTNGPSPGCVLSPKFATEIKCNRLSELLDQNSRV